MGQLGLVDAFRRYGAAQANPQWAVTAISADGSSLVVSCWAHHLRPAPGGMRYEDRLSRWQHNSPGTALARRHFEQARDEGLPVRLIIGTSEDPKAVERGASASATRKDYHLREDLVGQVVEFDGDLIVIDFKQVR